MGFGELLVFLDGGWGVLGSMSGELRSVWILRWGSGVHWASQTGSGGCLDP